MSTMTTVSDSDIQEHLYEFILHPRVLISNCPLDYGRHDTPSLQQYTQTHLGVLDRFSLEITQIILVNIDVGTLLGFRSVNRWAMAVVDGIPQWKKVIIHAPDTIRMSIGIGTVSNFTILDLCAALCKRVCAAPACNHITPYFDIFALERRCLSENGLCTNRWTFYDEYVPSIGSSSGMLRPGFRVIPGTYGLEHVTRRKTLYTTHIGNTGPDLPAHAVDVTFMTNPGFTSVVVTPMTCPVFTSVAAPWLDSSTIAAEPFIVCTKCWRSEHERVQRQPLFDARGRPRNDFVRLRVFTSSDLLIHMDEKHADMDEKHDDQDEEWF